MKTAKKILLTIITTILVFSGTIVEADACDPVVNLPPDYVTMLAVDGPNSWFDMSISDVPSGYDVTDGDYLGWCIQRNVTMSRGVNHTVTFHSSYDPNMPESFQDDDWDKVNYIINHKKNYGFNSIQKAIWYFIDTYEYPSDPDAQSLIFDANASGSGFCPGSGDIIAILVEGVSIIQRTFFELSMPEPNGNNNGAGNPGGGSTSNHAPTADAYVGEPYQGFVDSEITFDGSHSYDRDGYIVSWYWDFGDGSNGSGEIVTHIYSHPGVYTVILTVTDDDGAKDSYETVASIAIGNRPPSAPTVNGTKIGTRGIDYIYTAVSTDFDNDTIRYVFDWDDNSENTVTDYAANNTAVNTTHNWSSADVCILKVYAQDENNATSGTTEMLILIDVDVEFIDDVIEGYLIDFGEDETYDIFHNNATGNRTGVEKQENGTYLIDSDGDGEWDYAFDLITGLTSLHKEEQDTEEGQKGLPDFEVILLILAISLVLLWRRKRK